MSSRFTLPRSGFLRGYRTYLIGFAMALSALVDWAVGDANGTDLLARLPDILEGLGLATLRAGMSQAVTRLEALLPSGNPDA